MQQTVELPQVQHTDEIVDVAAVMRHQVPTTQTAHTQRQVPVMKKASEPRRPHRCSTPSHIMLEQVAEVIQVIPQESISERTVEQTVDVPLAQRIDMIGDVPVEKQRQSQYPHQEIHVLVVTLPQTTEILQEQVQQRTVELEHQSQLTPAFIQKELESETNDVCHTPSLTSVLASPTNDVLLR